MLYSVMRISERRTIRRATRWSLLASLMGLLLLAACDTTDPDPGPDPVSMSYDFDDGPQRWTGFFTNFTVGMGDGMNQVSAYRPMPDPPNVEQGSFLLAATNTSDDVKMMMKQRLDDLAPNTTYDVQFTTTFASDAGSGCVGIGGAPGEDVRVFAVATAEEPAAVVDTTRANDYIVLSTEEQQAEADFGGDRSAWLNAAAIGNVANGLDQCTGTPYALKTLESAPDHWTVTTDADGTAWLLVGTRSGFEGRTALYYTQVTATLRPLAS